MTPASAPKYRIDIAKVGVVTIPNVITLHPQLTNAAINACPIETSRSPVIF